MDGEINTGRNKFSRQIDAFQARLESLTGDGSISPEALAELQTLMEELLVADIELRQQNEALTEARQALVAERKRYQELFEFAPDGYLVTDMNGKIAEANRAAAQLLDVAPEYLIGKPLAFYIAVGDRPAFRRMLNLLRRAQSEVGGAGAQTLTKRIDEWEVRLKPRREPPYFAACTVEVAASQGALRWLVRDIRRRKTVRAELDELRHKLTQGREAERLEIARELHDGPVQDLYGLRFQIEALKSGLPDEKQGEVETLKEQLLAVAVRLRRLSTELRPPTLAPFGLGKAIASHASNVQENHPELKVSLDLVPDRQILPEELRLALYRIYQNALANVVQHAQASEVRVRLALEDGRLWLEVEDNGVGFIVPERWIEPARQGHLGLAGSAERAAGVGGSLEVRSQPGEGTSVLVTVPLPAELAAADVK